jgi:hypothetical protein
MWSKIRDLLTQAQEAAGIAVPELPDLGGAAEAANGVVTTAGERANAVVGDVAGTVSGAAGDLGAAAGDLGAAAGDLTAAAGESLSAPVEKASGLMESLRSLLDG